MHVYPTERAQAYLVSSVAEQLSSEAVPPSRRALWLQGRYKPEVCQAAIELLNARERASASCPQASRLFLTKDALEQATNPLLASYHSEQFPAGVTVLDAGCGAGFDSIALALRGCQILSVDIDPVHCLYARLNSEIAEVTNRMTVVRADLMRWPISRVQWLYADPMRRNTQGRLLNPEDWTPPLSHYLNCQPPVPNGVVKASPMLKPDSSLLNLRQISYIEVDGECKEALIKWGECAKYPGMRTAVHAKSGSEMLSAQAPPATYAPIGRYLIDPSAAILAADMLPQLGHQLNAWRISAYCGYLSSDECSKQPFGHHYGVISCFKYQNKRMKSYLLEHRISQVILKKRGLPAQWGTEWTGRNTHQGEVGLFAAFPVNDRNDVWIAHLTELI